MLKMSDRQQVSPRVYESAGTKIPHCENENRMETSELIEETDDGSVEQAEEPSLSEITSLYQRDSNARKITVYRLNTRNPPSSRIQINNMKKSVCSPRVLNLASNERMLMTIPSHSITTSPPIVIADRKRALDSDSSTSGNYAMDDEIQLLNKTEEDELYQTIASSEKLPITCRKKHAVLHKSKMGSGRNGKCIYFQNAWFTPSEFEHHCGLEGSKDWKRSLRYGGKPVMTLIQKGYLRPHATSCTCGICSDDTSLTGPIKYFTPFSRRKRTVFPSGQCMSNAPRRLQECDVKIYEQQRGVLSSLSSLNDGVTQIPDELLDLVQSTNTPFYKIIKYIFQAVNKVAADDRHSWEKLKIQADEIFEKYAKLQEAIEKTKSECEERRNSLLQDIITTLKTCNYSTDTIPAKSLRIEKPLEDQDEVPDDEATEICQACGQPANSECTGCHKATYCSTDCQEKDWNAGHRDACRKLQGQD